ncbi:MAG: ABC transporter substrate-binding protein [Spirochaetaceae bacterium]|jgi:peptide/nickel transport system substrate-binding protein|nr:ABC transporter substrate-binding protein [Spirochaetaceae bacterium]
MKKLHPVIAISLAGLIAVSVAGCRKTAQNAAIEGAPEGGAVIYSVFSDPMVIWDPSDTLSDEVIVFQNVYETLLRYDFHEQRFAPILAEQYEKSADGLEWTFKLRDGVRFHTGNTLTAEIVKKSIERLIERGMGAIELWDCLDEITVVDPLTVRFKLKFADDFEHLVSSAYGAYIFDVDAAEQHGEEWFSEGNDAGSGPYMVQRWTPDAEVVLAWFPDYWGGWHKRNFGMIVFKTTPEATTRELQLEGGDADIAAGLLPEQLAVVRTNSKFVVDDAEKFENLTLQMNTKKAPLNDVRVRKALAWAIPYEDIIMMMEGMARQSYGYIPQGLWGHDKSLFTYSYNPEEARRLLAEAGVGKLSLTLTYVASDDTERQVAEIMKSSFASVGIDLRLQAMTWEAQWDLAKTDDISRRQDLFLTLYWPTYADPYNLISMGYRTEEAINLNLSYYSNSEFDEIIDRARRIAGTNREEAVSLYKRAQEILIRDVPGVALFDTNGAFGIRKNFAGHKANPYYTGVVFFYNTWRE